MAIELYVRAADLGNKKAHHNLGTVYHEDLKKAKFHYEAAAVAGHEEARCMMGFTEVKVGNMERSRNIGQLQHLPGIILQYMP
jgi:TPR repeat protein